MQIHLKHLLFMGVVLLSTYHVYNSLIYSIELVGPDLRSRHSQNNLKENVRMELGVVLKSPPTNVTISIAAVVCSKYNADGPRKEATVMMKSAIISALLYGVASLKFYFFVEHIKDTKFLQHKLKVYGHPFKNLDVQLYFYDAKDAVPKKYHNHMINHPKFRCTYVRIFLPRILSHVDSILYLDNDIIVTGSLIDLWAYLGKMTSEQLIGVARNNEPENPNWPEVYKTWFADIPHPLPKGLNAGLLVMNLTRMRDYEWETKLLRLFDDYSRLYKMNDQRLLNILLRFDEGLLQILPCQFNFKFTHCDYGLYCKGADEDSKGIQIIHGAADSTKKKGSFHYIFLAYDGFNMITANYTAKVVIPIISAYHPNSTFRTTVGTRKNQTYSKCYGTLNKLLFKDIIA